MVECVYDRRFAFLVFLRYAAAVIAVDVTVDEIRRLVFVQQSVEALEAPVRQILQIVQTVGGRVRQQDIKAVAFLSCHEKLRTRVFICFSVYMY